MYGAPPSVAHPAGTPDVVPSEAFEGSFVWHGVVGALPNVEQAPGRSTLNPATTAVNQGEWRLE